MTDEPVQIACRCGASTFEAEASPLFRAICHCGICQRFNKADHADILVYRDKSITANDDSNVSYSAHKTPPLVMRGSCTICHAPAMERLQIPLIPRLTIVPVCNLAEKANLPDPALHMFYETRVQDAVDELPKYSGYLSSQLAFSSILLRTLIGKSR